MIEKKEVQKQIILDDWIITQKKGDSWKVRERAGDRVFSIRDLGANQWRTSAGSSSSSRRRLLVTALNVEEAVLAAERILYPADFVTNDHPHLDLADAFNLAIKQSYAGAEGKALLYRNAGYFVDWAQKRDIRLWEQVRLDTIHEYVQYLIAKPVAKTTIKSYLEPVKAAGKRVVAVYSDHYKDPCYAFRIPRRIGAPKTVAEKVGRRGLTIYEVIHLADFLSADKYAECLVPTVLMCGLLGCHVREVVYLTWDKIDLEAGILKVEEEIGHKAKTSECVRMIPLPDFLIERLKEVPRNGDRVITLVSERPGQPESPRPDNLIGQRFSQVAKKWKPERYVPLSDLRNTLINVARRNPLWSERLTEQYVGHADPSVSGRHYQSTDPVELFGLFQNGIIPLLNSEIEKALIGTKWQQNGKNPEVAAPGFEANIIDILDVS